MLTLSLLHRPSPYPLRTPSASTPKPAADGGTKRPRHSRPAHGLGIAVGLMLLVGMAVPTRAHDFSATAPSGQSLYYCIVDGGVEVVYPVTDTVPIAGWGAYERPSGRLVVPATVSHGGQEYAVVRIRHHAFFNCSFLSSVVLPEGLLAIGSSAFSRCVALASADLPSTLDTIADMAFGSCAALCDLTLRRLEPPYVSATAFHQASIGECTLHVGCASVGLYQAQEPWSLFGEVSDSGCFVALSVEVSNPSLGRATGSGAYAPGTVAMLATVPDEGSFFACWNDGDTLNPRLVTLTRDTHFVAHLFAVRRDTVRLADTLWVHDTVRPTLCRLDVLTDDPQRGLGVGSAVLAAGSEVEICALPLQGGRFAGWSDGGSDNPRRLTVASDLSLTAHFVQASAAEADEACRVSLDGRRATVLTPGPGIVELYDAEGRLLSRHASPGCLVLDLPAAGIYFLRFGTAPAHKLVVRSRN